MHICEIRKEENAMKKLLCLALCLVICLPCLMALGEAAEKNEITVPELTILRREIPDNEAMDFLKKMGVGWNLGNTFDAIKQGWNANADEMTLETSWCGVRTTEAMFDALKEAGFTSVRIPVSWHDHVSGEDHEISERWMSRVQEVVDWAYDRGFYVILNIHHDEDQFLITREHAEASSHYIACVWNQIAERFRDYDEHLIFESMNEPRVLGASYEWNYNPAIPECVEAGRVLNELNQLFVDTVRATGGRNVDRYLMVPGYAAAPAGALNDVYALPTDSADNRIMVSVHAYTPYDFALNNNGGKTFGTQSQKQEIVSFMNALYGRFTVQGIPVVIGEYGALSKGDQYLQDRVDFTAFYVATASARNFPCLWWDNNAYSGNGEKFGVLDRRNARLAYPDIVDAIMTYAGWDNLPAAQ